MADEKPDTPSGDYAAMSPYWDMVGTILDGAAAMRNAREKYLPKFPNEAQPDYDFRCKNAKFTNIYRDIVENLASKPFSKECKIIDGTASTDIVALAEDIDGQGNSLHVFASDTFFRGINNAIDWIFIDKAPVPENATRADEKAAGVRPYWVHVPAKNLLAVYSDTVEGKEAIVHARVLEVESVRDGFEEVTKTRVRELNREKMDGGGYGPATFRLWEKIKAEAPGLKSEWIVISEGAIAIGEIALVPYITGMRIGASWQIVPAMQDAAYLQIEHFQQESNLKSVKGQACFPMLAGNGVSPPTDDAGNAITVPVGPHAVLFAPPNGEGQHGEWKFIEPSAQTLQFLAEDIKSTEQQLRELGRQPLTAQTGNLTVVTTAFAAQKGNSAVQAWALNLKDALEQAFMFTAKWLNDETSQPEVYVHTDFAIEMESDKAPDFLLKMQERNLISREALIVEAKRRDFLSPEYDAEADQEQILKEMPSDPQPQDVTAAADMTGQQQAA